MAATKCSARLVKLRAIQQMVNKMIELNNEAARVDAILGVGDAGASAILILAAGGDATPHAANTLSAATIVLINALDWAYLAES